MNADRLLLFLLVIFLATNVLSGSYDRNAHADNESAKSEVLQAGAVAPVKGQRPNAQPQQAAEHADHESAPMNTYQAWSLILTALIVYITAKYTHAAYLQLEKLNESIGANKDAADAAQRSARVAERALTELEVPCVSIAEVILHVLDEMVEPGSGPKVQRHPWIQYSFRNDGRSFAKLTSVFGTLQVCTEIPGNLSILASGWTTLSISSAPTPRRGRSIGGRSAL